MAMLSTVSQGRIVSRPMSAQDMGPDGTIWFLASADSHKVDEISANPTVCVAFVDPGKETYVSVAGTARVTNDRKRIAEFWNPFYKAWFDGPRMIPRSGSLRYLQPRPNTGSPRAGSS